MVAVDSNYEPVTEAAFRYREREVYPHLVTKGWKLSKWQGPLARRYYVAPEVKKPEVEYITGVGHGAYDLYTGHFGDPIFQVGNYQPEEATGKIVHFLSCQTGRRLGPDFVAHGCRAYFGYDENFTFHFEEAEIFFECDSEIDLAFAEADLSHAHSLHQGLTPLPDHPGRGWPHRQSRLPEVLLPAPLPDPGRRGPAARAAPTTPEVPGNAADRRDRRGWTAR